MVDLIQFSAKRVECRKGTERFEGGRKTKTAQKVTEEGESPLKNRKFVTY
jgi:hypothetical protein